MVMLMTEAMHIPLVAAGNPRNSFLQLLNWAAVHSDWVGLLPHDMIQPGFTFLVGVWRCPSVSSAAAAKALRWRA